MRRPSGKNPYLVLLTVALLFASLMFGDRLIAPDAVTQAHKNGQFNTQRAFERINRILGDQRPHPLDSEANHLLLDRLTLEVTNLGFEPEINRLPVCRSATSGPFAVCAEVTNMAFRLGPDRGEAVLVTTHYDSVPAGPGAADAHIGVAVLLETAFLLSERNDLARPIIFLITDGEEAGLLGARAFIDQDPLAKQVKTIVNFEARGVSGPAFMFETSQPNGRVIPAYVQDAKRPVANSVMAAIYEAIPNSTDVAVYLPEGYEALNFAVIQDEPFYHTPHDNLENLSLPSLQHMGDLGVSTIATLASGTSTVTDTRLAYTDILSRFMIVLPQATAIPVLALTLLLAITGFYRSRPENTDGRPFVQVKTLISPLAVVVSTAIIGFILQQLIGMIRAEGNYWYAHSWASLGWTVLLAVALSIAIPRLILNQNNDHQLFCAAWIWFAVIGIATTLALPGASILFFLPAIVFIVAMLVRLLFSTAKTGWLALVTAIPVHIVWLPTLSIIGDALGFGAASLISVLTAIALLPWLTILGTPMSNPLKMPASALPLLVTVTGTILFSGLAMTLPAYSERAPQQLNIISYVDHDSGQAYVGLGGRSTPIPGVMTAGQQIQPPTRIIPELDIQPQHAVIPFPDLSPPDLSLMSRRENDDGSIELRVQIAATGADRFVMRIPSGSGVTHFEYRGEQYPFGPISGSQDYAVLRCYGISCDGQEIGLTLQTETDQPWLLSAEYFGVIPEAQAFYDARPKTATARHSGDRTISFKRKQL